MKITWFTAIKCPALVKQLFRLRFFLVLVPALLPACASVQHDHGYREGSLSIQEKSEIQPYDLAYIEFDDQGDYWDDGQLDRVLAMIDRVNLGAGYEPNGDSIGSVFVTFIHGWRNNAADGNQNLKNFEATLVQLVNDERRAAAASGRSPRPVAGIYVAWRGDALRTVPALNWLDVFTFWNRNSTAVRIASCPPATHALLLMLKEIQGKPNARSIVVGHSMGALILERAVSQALVGMIVEAKYRPECPNCPGDLPDQLKPGKFKPPADLIVLVNSAAPAQQAQHLVQVLQDFVNESSYSASAPLLLSITAENDKATKQLFPIAMTLESRRQRFQQGLNPDQVKLVRHSAGHVPALHSHERLEYEENGLCQSPGQILPLGVVRCPESHDGNLVFTIDTVAGANGVQRRKYTLKRRLDNATPNLYWILQAPDTVIDGHSDFFRGEFTDFLRAIITVTGASRPEGPGKLYSTPVAEAKQ